MNKKALLVVLDGWGIGEANEVNAFYQANTPNLDQLLKTYPTSKLYCSGEAVGLPEGQQGNSEVGHLNLGAGRVVYQELLRIERAIKDGAYYENEAFIAQFEKVKQEDKALHLMGLLSDGGVHSHQDHLYALLKLSKEMGLSKVYIHAFMDGRDVPPQSGIEYLKNLENEINKIGIGQIATISGRYYAMDRDNRWDRVEKAYDAIALGIGEKVLGGQKAIINSYNSGITDEFILPTVVLENYLGIQDGDGVLFFNFRADRARELTKSLILREFSSFFRKRVLHDITMVTMTAYEKGLEEVLKIAFPPHHLENTLGEYLSKNNKRQIRIAETEKYAHVTFFFNGGIEAANQNEDRVLIPSPKVATYDLMPEMSAKEVGLEVINSLKKGYDFILVNFANPDMVGHTGKLEPAKQAMEAVDKAIGQIAKTLDLSEYTMLICADHGNCEKMADDKGVPFTSHTSNPVHVVMATNEKVLLNDGALCDIAPTILEIMSLKKPEEMTGKSLIK